jgi:hypothetical protein
MKRKKSTKEGTTPTSTSTSTSTSSVQTRRSGEGVLGVQTRSQCTQGNNTTAAATEWTYSPLTKAEFYGGYQTLGFFLGRGGCPQKNKTVGEGGFFHQWYDPPLVPQGVLSSNQCCVEFSSNFNSFFQIICILIEKLWFRF